MPSTFTHSPAEIERKEPGIGGKPPVTRRPTGGGGGGGDDDWKNERRGPRERLRRNRQAVFLYLAADMVFFAVLILIFYANRVGTHMDPRSHRQVGDWRPILLPPILYLNTAVLVLSGLTMELARRSIFREVDVLEEWLGLGKPAVRRAMPWLISTLALGGLFVAGQVAAWRQLTAQGFAFNHNSTPASYFFYLITGFHALHLLVGVIALILCVGGLSLFKRVEDRQIVVDSTGWYWHAMGIAWMFLLAVLVLGE